MRSVERRTGANDDRGEVNERSVPLAIANTRSDAQLKRIKGRMDKDHDKIPDAGDR